MGTTGDLAKFVIDFLSGSMLVVDPVLRTIMSVSRLGRGHDSRVCACCVVARHNSGTSTSGVHEECVQSVKLLCPPVLKSRDRHMEGLVSACIERSMRRYMYSRTTTP